MKYKLYIIFYIISTTLFSQNTNKIFNSGHSDNKDFKVTLPYEIRGGLLVVKAEIKNDIYNLIFDTGAVTTISKEMHEKLNLKKIKTGKVSDISDTKKELSFSVIDTIKIGGINFYDIGTAILDVDSIQDFKCMKIDGFLGSNLLKEAIWEIDMKKKEITFSNSLTSFQLSENTPKTKLYIGYGGVPSVTTYLDNNKLYNTVIDYGFGGNISLLKDDFNKIIKKNSNIKYTKAIGSSIASVYGDLPSREYFQAIINQYKIDNFLIPEQLISFGSINSRVIGNGFLRDYKVILSWKDKSAWFIKNYKTKEPVSFKTFGYGFQRKNNEIYISSIYENSESSNKGLKLGDKILKINTEDYTNITNERWCEIINTPRADKQNIVIERKGEKMNFDLDKKILIQKNN
ncbi:aspartyl protease family protein [Empedobacter sp.]|uniref:aspartyl protease family protein n=1 Tax=Empedobacter sp. TaxID=1927715 RepID=UPI0028970E2E|nr:aspartyl protease family protein [Empedobacter sp.]